MIVRLGQECSWAVQDSVYWMMVMMAVLTGYLSGKEWNASGRRDPSNQSRYPYNEVLVPVRLQFQYVTRVSEFTRMNYESKLTRPT